MKTLIFRIFILTLFIDANKAYIKNNIFTTNKGNAKQNVYDTTVYLFNGKFKLIFSTDTNYDS